MPSFTIKKIPDDLLHELRQAAARDRRSLNQQILYLLSNALRQSGRAPFSQLDLEAQLAAWRKLPGRWETDAEDLMAARTGGCDETLKPDRDS